MKSFYRGRRAGVLLLLLAVTAALSFPSSALFRRRSAACPRVLDFVKNGRPGEEILFSPDDFVLTGETPCTLKSITLNSLPAGGTGFLTLGGIPLQPGAVLDESALSGLSFQVSPSPSAGKASFTFFTQSDRGPGRQKTSVTLYFSNQDNQPPIAKNAELSVYRDVPLTGRLSAADKEGDTLTFHLISSPARGSLSFSRDDPGVFLYTPYENKTGKDSFTYVVRDSAGNQSPEAHVRIRIRKPDTGVRYSDLEGHPAHKAAIHLAEDGVYTGENLNGRYFFNPDRPVTRARFLTMAMSAAGTEPLSDVVLTGFHDDRSIPAWAKGSVSAALKQGVISGSRDEYGAPVFSPDQAVTRGEAAVILNRLLNIADVPVEVFSPGSGSHWAAQASANLNASGITSAPGTAALSQPLTMGDAALLLDGVMDFIS